MSNAVTSRTDTLQALPPLVASAAPTSRSRAVLQPLGTGDVRVGAGFWGDRLRRNRAVSLAAGAERLEASGALHNLRAAAGREPGGYAGSHPFKDSDVFKWLEAVSWELGRDPSAELLALAEDTIELIVAAQLPEGYLNSYGQLGDPAWRFSDLAMGHELYCAGHLLQAGVAHARAVGDGELLPVVRRYADYLDDVFGPGRREGTCGHPEIEMALVELYRVTAEPRYLELARTFLDRRGHGLLGTEPFGARYFQDHAPVRESHTVTGHAVRALYLACAVVDAYLETGDESLLQASVRQWEDMVEGKTHVTGGVGSRERDEAFTEPWDLSPDHAYCETCAAIASIMWSWRLLLATGEARYADLIERTLYNGFLSGVSLDGDRFLYVNPLQVRGRHERAEWYDVACCPPNVMRLLASLEHYVATTTDAGVQVHQYMAGTIAARAGGPGDVALDVTTAYPWDGHVALTVSRTSGAPWTLSLRIPDWCERATLAVNGAPVAIERGTTGYAELVRRWQPGDRVELALEMPARRLAPHPWVDAVRGCVALVRGPLVYCVEQADLSQEADLAAVAVGPAARLEAVRREDLLGGVVALETSGLLTRVQSRAGEWPYRSPGEGRAPDAPARLLAVPYFAWGNRGAGAMRVWIPEVQPEGGER